MILLCRKNIKKAKEEHDIEYMGLDPILFKFKRDEPPWPQLNEIPYDPDSSANTEIAIQNREFRTSLFSTNYKNLLRTNGTWLENDLMPRMNFFLRRKSQNICKGNVSKH